MAKTKNTSAISASAGKTTNKTKTSGIVRDAVPYVERSKDSAASFCGIEPFAFHILSETMLPNFNLGDTVVIDPYRKPKDGDFVVAGLPGQPLAFRKYVCTPGASYQLLATNPQYAPLDPVLPVVGVMTSHHSKVDERKDAERAIVSLISSARSSVEDDDMGNEAPLSFPSSQIDTDFALAAQLEVEGDLSIDNMDQGFFDLFRSATYWTLRDAFVKAALVGDEYAFMSAVWRGYNAGRVSTDRFVANTKKSTQTAHASTTSDRTRRAGNAK